MINYQSFVWVLHQRRRFPRALIENDDIGWIVASHGLSRGFIVDIVALLGEKDGNQILFQSQEFQRTFDNDSGG